MAGAAVCALRVSRQEILNCAIPVWYDKFKTVTFKSVLIPLSADFVDYLNADGVILPHGCSLPSHKQSKPSGDSESDSDEEKVDWSDSDSDSSGDDKEPYFPALVEKMQSAIDCLGGRVVPKLNWSTPRDAAWLLAGNTMQCSSVGEIILLLKSSDFVAHDLTRVFKYCEETDGPTKQTAITYTLCLRQWNEFHPSAEFRCFVHNNALIAISQREHTTYYDFLVSHRDTIRQEIVDFFQHQIHGKFPDKNYVFDICRISEGNIRLVDFNPFSPMTDSLLFSWDELSSSSTAVNGEGGAPVISPVIRVFEGASSIRPHDLHTSRLPQDIVDLASGEEIHKFVDFYKSNKLDEDRDSDSPL